MATKASAITATRIINKKIGQTPLEAIREFIPENISATYAGRLDPMASGKLLVLLGEETKRKEKYMGLDKEYVIEILLDAETDTGDILGLPSFSLQETRAVESFIKTLLQSEIGTHTIPYPPFSSKPVDGKPLFTYALAGTLDTIEIPTHKETIHSISLLSTYMISSKGLEKRIENDLAVVPTSDELSKKLGADFRQHEIRAAWKDLFAKTDRSFQVLQVRVTVGSGTYMRSLASRIGAKLGTKACALSIHRSKIGKYRTFLTIPMWTKLY